MVIAMGAGDSIAILSLSENPGAWTSWLSPFHPTSPTLAASLADGASLSIAEGGWEDSWVYKMQDNWELRSDTASFPNTSAWKQNKTKSRQE